VKREGARPYLEAPAPFGSAVASAIEAEDLVLGAKGLEGVVLRYGFFYGPGTYYAREGSIAQQVRRRRFPVVGRGTGLFSHVHVGDAAEATVLALEHGEPGVYNVVDDEPAAMGEWVPAYAHALGAKRPLRVPAPVVRVLAGRLAASMGTELRGASNAKAREQLGWAPRHPSWREGFGAALDEEAGAP
jgi:nucleoside-diphosphate-sugar epimerase